MTPPYLDGNELGGVLGEMFAVDVTAAHHQCANCGRPGVLAETRVYSQAPGLVARCPGCSEVIMRVVRGPGRAWLDLRGMTYLEIGLPDERAG